MKSDNPDDNTAPLLEHLVELRNRLVYSLLAFLAGFALCYNFHTEIYGFLTKPLAAVLGPDARMIYTNLTEAFFTYIKVSMWASLMITFPFIATQMWMFVAPGLYRKEKMAFLPFLLATPVCFFAGAALLYYMILPMAWQFFAGFQTVGGDGTLPIQLEAKVNEYLSLTMSLVFAFGLAFELPVLLTLLGRVGIVSSEGLVGARRYAIVGCFVFAAIVTPPDVISQIGLAVPMILLYEISIFAVRSIERQRAAREAEADAENGQS